MILLSNAQLQDERQADGDVRVGGGLQRHYIAKWPQKSRCYEKLHLKA